MHFNINCDKISTGDFMRLRNVKNKEEIMNSSSYLIQFPDSYKGKWKELFGNNNPIYIEIGMGKGQFIINSAIMNPNINYIGIEKYDSVIAKALQKVPDGIKNLYMIREDALNIENLFSHEISKIFLNFSDPWPKKRHHLRRLSSEIFLKKYDNLFFGDNYIEMRTDNRDLFSYSLISFNNYDYKFLEVSLNLHLDNMPLVTTEYEDKFSNEGMPIYYLHCVKSKKDVN